MPSACLGGWAPGDDSCFVGHVGGACEACDLKQTRSGVAWAQSALYTCGKCEDVLAQNTIIIVFISLFTLLNMVISVKGTYETVEEFLKNQVRATIGVLVKDNKSTLITTP
jgi:hypothetical protein